MKKLLFIPLLFLFIFKAPGQNSEFNSKTLSKAELSNIVAFAKIYGYVRHFYPSTEVDQMKNWEKLIVDNLPKMEQSANTAELETNLSQAFLPYSPLLSINREVLNVFHTGKFIVYRKNNGWGNRGENATRVTLAVYTSNLVRIPIDSILPNYVMPPLHRLTKKINDNISISWPLTIFANDSFTLPHDYGFASDTNQYTYKSSDRQVRMGCIIEFWNVMQHFYPYMDELKINHDPILEKYLQLASEANNEEQFFGLLELLGAEYKDGHAAFMPYYYANWADYIPPIRVERIEGKLIVTYVDSPDSIGINTGDEIVKINGVSAEKWFRSKSEKVSSATKTWNTFTSCKELFCGELNSELTVKVKSAKGEIVTKVLTRSLKVGALDKKATTRPQIEEYKSGYYYIDLCSLNDSMLNNIEQTILPHAKGLVFDMRGYPRVRVEKLFRHIYPDTLYSAIWQIPIAIYPDRDKRNTEIDTSGRWKIAPAAPACTKNVAFIIDGRVISAAETEMGIVENYKLGTIVGEQSAGTNGNINTFNVYKLYIFWFTGMRVIKHDGSQHHGVGIVPNIQVHKTINDVRNGHDAFIETAKKSLK